MKGAGDFPVAVTTGEPADDVRYICQRCGNCCRWPGFVRLETEEPDRIAAHLGMEVREFLEAYTEVLPSRSALGLRSLPDGACVFLEGRNHCRIQAAKPLQCRGFPNAWRFPGWRDVCEALPEGDTPSPGLAAGRSP